MEISRAGESPQDDINERIWSAGVSNPNEYPSSDHDCHFGVVVACNASFVFSAKVNSARWPRQTTATTAAADLRKEQVRDRLRQRRYLQITQNHFERGTGVMATGDASHRTGSQVEKRHVSQIETVRRKTATFKTMRPSLMGKRGLKHPLPIAPHYNMSGTTCNETGRLSDGGRGASTGTLIRTSPAWSRCY